METLGWILFWLVWLACGVLSYGLVKNHSRLFLEDGKREQEFRGYSDVGEQLCLLFGLGGPIGLLSGLSIAWRNGLKLGLCYCMPEELCSPEYLKKEHPPSHKPACRQAGLRRDKGGKKGKSCWWW